MVRRGDAGPPASGVVGGRPSRCLDAGRATRMATRAARRQLAVPDSAWSHLSAVALHGFRAPLGPGADPPVAAAPGQAARRRTAAGACDVVRHPAVGTCTGHPGGDRGRGRGPGGGECGSAAGIVAADAALRSGVTRTSWSAALELGRLGRGRREAARVVGLGRWPIRSPGESWARLVMAEVGLPTPDSQGPRSDDTGAIAGASGLPVPRRSEWSWSSTAPSSTAARGPHSDAPRRWREKRR